jgi:GntR family transcriptional regulator
MSSRAKIKKIPVENQKYEIDLKSADPLYFQLKDLIKRQIADKIWQFDKMIPSENELAATYEVSVGTVKKALSVLVEEGVLYRRQGKGTFVARPDFKRSFIRFFRYGLGEGKEGDFPYSTVLNSEIRTPSKRVQKTLQLDDDEKVIKIKRLRSIDGKPLMLEDIFLPYQIFKGFDGVDISQQLLYPIYDVKYQTPVIWADEFLWPQIAKKESAEILGIKLGDPVICIERVAYTYGDKPVEFRSSMGRGDRFRYHIEIR